MGRLRRRAAGMVKSGFAASGGALMLRLLTARRGALILRYHSVSDPGDGHDLYLDPSLAVSPETFAAHLRFLRRCYRPLSLDELVERLERGSALPPRAVAITFDDGYADNYRYAFPLLRRHGVPGTFYLTTGPIDGEAPLWTSALRFALLSTRAQRLEAPAPLAGLHHLAGRPARLASFAELVVRLKNIPTASRQRALEEIFRRLDVTDLSPLDGVMLSWEQVREMHAAGMSFGPHTVTHPSLPRTSAREAECEVVRSKAILEERLGTRMLHFSYPNGRGSAHVTPAVKEIVRGAGLRSAVTSLEGPVRGGDDLFELRRVGVYRKHRNLCHLAVDVERTKLRVC